MNRTMSEMMTGNEVMEAVKRHHIAVKEKYGEGVVFTALVGSQNYGLAHNGSDIDTYTFVLPSIESMAKIQMPTSSQFNVEDGICSVKDLRVAMNLLAKTTPNSLEWFCSKYKVYEKEYQDLLEEFMNPMLNDYVHASYKYMLEAAAGMIHQIGTRNMPEGKKYSHALRIRNLWNNFIQNKSPDSLLDFEKADERLEAFAAKLDPEPEGKYLEKINKVDEEIKAIKSGFVMTPEMKARQEKSLAVVRDYQVRFLNKHLKGELEHVQK